MAQLNNIDIPDDLDIRIERLVEEGEFEDYEEAVQEVLSAGVTAYRTDHNASFESEFDDGFDAGPQHEDEYIF